MDFQTAIAIFQQLNGNLQAGAIDINAYRQQLAEVRVVDQAGRTWMIQEQTGQWFVWDGSQWQPGTPTVPAASPAIPQPSHRLAEASYAADPASPGPTPSRSCRHREAMRRPAVTLRRWRWRWSSRRRVKRSRWQPRRSMLRVRRPMPRQVGRAMPRQRRSSISDPGCATVTFRIFVWALL